VHVTWELENELARAIKRTLPQVKEVYLLSSTTSDTLCVCLNNPEAHLMRNWLGNTFLIDPQDLAVLNPISLEALIRARCKNLRIDPPGY
jgi:hypothetical protein